MTINEHLLNRARSAGEKLAEAERQVQATRAEYHAVVRQMHLAGASLREIAHALAVSHQRVQQMVEGAGGSWWQRVWRSRNAMRNPKAGLSCTFCKRGQDEVAKLIAGPNLYICDACVAGAEKAQATGLADSRRGALAPAAEGVKAKCSFCGKAKSGDKVLAGTAGNICAACLGVCRQILDHSAA